MPDTMLPGSPDAILIIVSNPLDAMCEVARRISKLPRERVFGMAGVVNAQVLAFAALIGGISIPGAFLAKAFVERMPLRIHTAILDAAVITGGAVMITSALRH